MWVQMLTEPTWGPQLPASIVPTATYGELHPICSCMPICLRNLSAHPIKIPAKVLIGKVALATQVPLVTLPMGTSGECTCGPWKDWILEELSLQGVENWPKDEQEQARKLLIRWEHLFAHSNLDLAKTSLVKH